MTPPLERCAGAALVRAGAGGPEVLAIRVRAGAYELPKGHLEPGEGAAEAALRELAEETGLEGAAKALAPLGELAYELGGGGRKQIVYVLCAAEGGAPRFGPRPRRTRELRWLGASEVDGVPLVNEGLRPIVRAALAAGAAGAGGGGERGRVRRCPRRKSGATNAPSCRAESRRFGQ
ncbi:MAG TPA: NUDIX domain-containing protein [Polyangiaceae bacterium]|nr:NUDIX domain-containing protein [Polyangiaceae bacterium]